MIIISLLTLWQPIHIKLSDKQSLLEVSSVKERLNKIIEFIDQEIGVLQVEKKIRRESKSKWIKQKEYYLNEQIKAIQRELGDTNDVKDEINEIEEK